MGLLERFRPTAMPRWQPPAPGDCRCAHHLDNLLDLRVPLADGSGDVAVADLAATGALSTVPTQDNLWIDGSLPEERYGPFHWRVVHQDALNPFLSPTAPTHLDDVLYLQSGVERVAWLANRTVLAVGGSRLCTRGVQGAVVKSLMSARLRIS